MQEFHFNFTEHDPAKPVILAFHGTGGDEFQFRDLLTEILPGPNIFGIRGKVSEAGANRYFARFAEGQLDYEDLAFRTQELADFLHEKIQNRTAYAIGYSNGANIAANLLLTGAFPIAKAILLRPMFLSTEPTPIDSQVQICAGLHDPICPADDSKKLAETLTNVGAKVDLHLFESGHNLIGQDFEVIRDFLKS